MSATVTTRGRCTDGHQVEIRKKRAVGGGDVFVLQCTGCGRQIGRPVPRAKVPDPRKVSRFDARRAHRPQPNSKRRTYEKYLRSARWKKLRTVVLARDNNTCQAPAHGGGICGAIATEAAHRHYDRPLGEERLSDLFACCGPCNLREREERIKRAAFGGEG